MERGVGRRNSVERKDGKLEGILYSWKKRKDEFGTGVFGRGRRKMRGRGRRKSVQWEREEEGGILYSEKRSRKEEFCRKERWEVKRNSVQLEEEEGLIRYRGIWKRKEEGKRGRQEKICTVGRGRRREEFCIVGRG